MSNDLGWRRFAGAVSIILCCAAFLSVAGCAAASKPAGISYKKLLVSSFERKEPPTDIKLTNIGPEPLLVLCRVVFGEWEESGVDEGGIEGDQYLNAPDVLVESVKEFARFVDSVSMPPDRAVTVEEKFFSALSRFLTVNYYGVPVEHHVGDEKAIRQFKEEYRKNAKNNAMSYLRKAIASGKEPYYSYSLYFVDVWGEDSALLRRLVENKEAPEYLRFSALCKLTMRAGRQKKEQLSLKYSRRLKDEFAHMKGWRPESFFTGTSSE